MKKIVIVGNAVAGVSAAEEIRRHDAESNILIFCEEPNPPFRPDLFAGFLANDVAEADLLYRPAEFYEKQRIGLVTDKKVLKFNFNRKYLTTDDKEKTDYDVLILTDTADTRLPDVKGTNKTGVFGLRKMEDVKNVQKYLAFVETAMVFAQSIEGIEAACALKKRGKETVLITAAPVLLPGFLDEDSSALILRELEALGIRVLTATAIDEILGDTEVKAVRLNSGKVLACDAVLFPDAGPSLKRLMDSNLEIDNGVCVDENLRTNIDQVFAAGDICEQRGRAGTAVRAVSVLEEQGWTIAGQILPQAATPASSVPVRPFAIGSLSGVLLGSQPVKDGILVPLQKDMENKSCQAVLTHNGIVKGAVLINAADSQQARIADLIAQNASLEISLAKPNFLYYS